MGHYPHYLAILRSTVDTRYNSRYKYKQVELRFQNIIGTRTIDRWAIRQDAQGTTIHNGWSNKRFAPKWLEIA